MCGIAGYVNKNGIEAKLLEKMTGVLAHRGPDTSGIWLSPDTTVGFGHSRLKIIDLSLNANQPMSDTRLGITVIFNGEIYNFSDLRKELERAGNSFKSTSDTEVLLRAYATWGLDCLPRLLGMFAFALYDSANRKILLARDRAGKKPLYYYMNGGIFAFSSELKSLVQTPFFVREVDLDALNAYFSFGYIPGQLSIYKNVCKLPAGSYLELSLEDMRLETGEFWEVPVQELSTPGIGPNGLLEEFEILFNDAVSKRMVSDVPYGALLSGGLDSSLVVAMMSRITDKPVRTFSIGFDEQGYDETSYARQIAKHFKTEHHEQIVKTGDFAIMAELSEAFDEPFADQSLLPTHYLMKMAKDEVTVALSGDGGDEVFGGYPAYSRTMFDQRLALPKTLKQLAVLAGHVLPDFMPGTQRLLRQKMTPEESFLDRRMTGYFRMNARRALLTDHVMNDLKDRFFMPEASGLEKITSAKGDLLYRLTSADFRTYLTDGILVKVDRASMWNSLEVRSPFLDHRIIEFSFRKVPSSMKVNGSVLKYILKLMAKKILPGNFELNRKWGFALPIKKWFRNDKGSMLATILKYKKNDYIREEYIDRLTREHVSGKVDHSDRLFAVIMFMLWKERWLG